MAWGEISAIFAALAAVFGVAITCLLTVGKIGRMAGIMETTLGNQNQSIGSLRDEIKELKSVVTIQAVQTTRIDSMGAMMVQLQRRIDEISHGEGFVLPIDWTNLRGKK